MKTIITRLRRLEERAAARFQVPDWVPILVEKQRRRAEANGLVYQEPWRDPELYANGRRPTWAQVLQSHQARRCRESERAALAAGEGDKEQLQDVRTP
jgi:hypothetical protein